MTTDPTTPDVEYTTCECTDGKHDDFKALGAWHKNLQFVEIVADVLDRHIVTADEIREAIA